MRRFVPLSDGEHALAMAACAGRPELDALRLAGATLDGERVPGSAYALRRAAAWALYHAERSARDALRVLRSDLCGAASIHAGNAARYAAAAGYLREAARERSRRVTQNGARVTP